jgi:DNA-binding response OmpR family regulator
MLDQRRGVIVCTDGPDGASIVELLRSSGYRALFLPDMAVAADRAPDLIVWICKNPSVVSRQAFAPAEGIPIIVIGPGDTPLGAAQCLLDGADDYLGSPFNHIELLARIHRTLRRQDAQSRPRTLAGQHLRPSLCAPSIRLRLHDWSVLLDDKVIRLTEAQFGIIARLLATPGEWVRTGILQAEVLRASAAAGASNVRFHILRLRRSFGPSATCLHGRQRRGYMWSTDQCDSRRCMCRATMPTAISAKNQAKLRDAGA